MDKNVEKDTDLSDVQLPDPVKQDRFPRIVLVIILTEFCERFSYSGMRAFLTLYLRSKLGYSDDEATETYHVFSTFVYVFPIIGGILADNYLGKFRTILYMMFVYAAGNMLVAVTAIPHLALPGRLCTMIGLFLITMGTGGIKPCVTSFGGDQFKLPEQENHLVVYFSILYFSLCVGSLIAKTVSPILRAEVHCFGDKDCYSLAFGAPGLVVLASIVIFVSAKSRYVMKKPTGNIVVDFIKCVSLGLKNAILKRNRNEKDSHWLDSTRHHYDQRFIKDIKKTLSILMIFTVLPVFFAMLDQMGSRWTLQATKMDGRFGFITVKPDQMQVIGPIFILILIPISQKYVYPFLERRNILKNPLDKLTVGGVLAGVALIASAVVEIYLKTTYPQLPQPGLSQMRIFNGNPCFMSLYHQENFSHEIPPLSYYVKKDFPVRGFKNINITLEGGCVGAREEMLLLEENSAISFYLMGDIVNRFKDKLDKSKSGFPVVRFLVSTKLNGLNMTLYNEKRRETETFIYPGISPQIEIFTSRYSIKVGNDTIKENIEMESGGVYTIMIDEHGDEYKTEVITITEANSITMALMLPQFFIMSVAEVLFAVTGNEFAFKESPESMKAVMTAVWLLTEAVGNVIIIIITRLFVNFQQETQSFIYTGMMFISMVVLHHLSKGYKHGEEDTIRDCRSNNELHQQLKGGNKSRSNSEVLYLQLKQTDDCLEH